jgi:hypothetical protein
MLWENTITWFSCFCILPYHKEDDILMSLGTGFSSSDTWTSYPLFEGQTVLLDSLAFLKHDLVSMTAVGDSTPMKDLLQAAQT